MDNLTKKIEALLEKRRKFGLNNADAMKKIEMYRRVNDKKEHIAEADIDELAETFIDLAFMNSDAETFSNDLVKHSKFKELKEPSIINIIWDLTSPALNNNVLGEFMSIPYEFDENSDEVKKVKEAGLFENLNTWHRYLKNNIAPDEISRNFFSTLYITNNVALLQIIFIIAYLNGLSPTDKKALTIEEIKKSKPLNSIYNFIVVLDNYCECIDDDIKSIGKRTEKLETTVRAILSRLEMDQSISISQDEFDKIKDPQILNLLLNGIIDHNEKYNNQVREAKEEEKQKSELELLFKGSSIKWDSFSKEQQDLLSRHGIIDSIKQILEQVNKSKNNIFEKDFPTIDILLLSTPKIVAAITKMINSNLIDTNFIKDNPEVFVEEIKEDLEELVTIKTPKYATFVRNMKAFKEIKIDTRILSKSNGKNSLLGDHNRIEEIIRLVQSYGLQYGSSNDFSIFEHPELISTVDKFIELGLENFIRQNPKYINLQSDNYINRLLICNDLQIGLEIKNKLPSIITNDQFSVNGSKISDEDITGVIPNDVYCFANEIAFKTILNNKDIIVRTDKIPELEKYSNTSASYKIGDAIISKPKVARNLQILNSSKSCEGLEKDVILFNAIIYGSVLDERQLKTISELISPEHKQKLEI